MHRRFSHFIILSILNIGDAEIHGYELKKRIEAEFGDTKEFFETDSSIYPVLKDLKKQELLDFRERIVSGRTQKLYFITQRGKELLPEMERQYMFFNSKIRMLFSSLAESGLKVSFQINMEELEGSLDNKLLDLTLYDLKEKISELPSKEMKQKYIATIYEKIGLLHGEIKKIEKSVNSAFVSGLSLPGHAIAYGRAITRAAWDAFPRCSRWHSPEQFVEVLVFHAMKAAGVPFNQAAFRAASPMGNMSMPSRHWLLHYQQHFPPSLRVASHDPGAEPFYAMLQDRQLAAEARVFDATHEDMLIKLRGCMRAGVCILLALRANPRDDHSTTDVLATLGIGMASAYNAAKRLGLLFPKPKPKTAVTVEATA